MPERKYSEVWREMARNPVTTRKYSRQEIRTLTEIVNELETDIKPLVLPELHSDVYSAIEHAENYRIEIDRWENDKWLRKWAEAWIVRGSRVYDESNGRIGSVEGKKAARYLETKAAESTGAKREMYLTQASLIEKEAEKLYKEKEQIHISPPL